MKTHLVIIFVIVMALCFLLGCASAQPAPATVEPPRPSVAYDLAWKKPEWTSALVGKIRQNLPSLKKAKDVWAFCPKYAKLNDEQKVRMFAELMVEMARYESAFNPKASFKEPPPLNIYSMGLYQLSTPDVKYGGSCTKVSSYPALHDPIKNINCAVEILAKLVARDWVISNSKNKGGARYWSVLRVGRKLEPIRSKVRKLNFCS
jgi:hypothetical protein